VSGRPDQRERLRRIAAEDPRLAARLVLMTLPGASAQLPKRVPYELTVDELGTTRIGSGEPEFRLTTDARTLVDMVTGAAKPLGLMLKGRLRVRGRRRRAMRLRGLSGVDFSMGDVVRAGGRLDPDVLYRSLPHVIDPEWTRGHEFTVRYVVTGEGGGAWYAQVRDGKPLVVSDDPPESGEVDSTATVDFDTYQAMVSGELTPTKSMQEHRTVVDGDIYPVTLMGRWIDRGQGQDDEELEREARQRKLQDERVGMWAPAGMGPGQGDPGHDSERGRDSGGLLDFRQLYALWETQQWKVHELDFAADKEHWLATPAIAQQSTMWSLGSFYVGEERVTADLAPFLLAAPTGEIELFLATQLVDESKHAAFFDRFGAEVMALSADDLRGRMREVEDSLLSPWRDVFDDGLRDVAHRMKAKPDNLDLFVEGIATYHMVVEGFLAVTGQTLIRDWMMEHSLYPGFCEGFGLVERDEHRHVAFGVRFLSDAIAEDSRHRKTVERVVLDLAPRAALVFCPPYADDPSDFMSYGYHSTEVYGRAYNTLKRRMKVLGIEIPPPDELMPGPIEKQPPESDGKPLRAVTAAA
jgi:ribonucleoside-diphosphate reductase beta chain